MMYRTPGSCVMCGDLTEDMILIKQGYNEYPFFMCGCCINEFRDWKNKKREANIVNGRWGQ